MPLKNYILCAAGAALLAGCGGGGGAGAGSGNDAGAGANGLPLVEDPPQPGAPSRDYIDLGANSGTSPMAGAILAAGSSATATTGTITHSNRNFTATGISGATGLNTPSPFDLGDFDFATDVAIDSSTSAVVGVSTAAADVRTLGSAAYTGRFGAQLVDSSQGPTAVTLDWDADMQINFAGDGDIDMTFTGGGSSLIDTIRILNTTIDGNVFSGGTIRTSINGAQNNVTGTDVDLNGAFFGYNEALLLPAEAGGVLVSNDGNTDISGVFILSARP